MADRAPYILWPGLAQPVSCTYSLSHGISPGVAVVAFLPQDPNVIQLQGDLVIGDGVGEVRLKNCKVAALRTTGDTDSGFLWTLEILDRRWRWGLGFVSGVHNVPDATRDVTRPEDPEAGPFLAPAQLYMPWTMRSPRDLMTTCLDAMGERGYVINAPNPLYPLPGVNWDYSNPAQCLSQLCESVGCRVVYRPREDVVWISPIGVGGDFPPGSVAREAPGLQSPQRPDTIVCVGAPVKFQVDWLLQAYGEEWDGSLKPIEKLSYAPQPPLTRHVVRVEPSNTVGTVGALTIYRLLADARPVIASYDTAGGDTVAEVVDGLVGALNILLGPEGFIAAGNNGPGASTNLTLKGPPDGSRFAIETDTETAAFLEWELVTQGGNPLHPWADAGVWAGNSVASGTDRLTYMEARSLADKSVWRYYKILNATVTGPQLFGNGGQYVPTFGQLRRIQQAVFLNEQINQILPTREDEQVMNAAGFNIVRDFYDGFFRTKPARCYGRHTQATLGLRRPGEGIDQNAGPGDEVLTEFTIVSDRALIIFHEPVYLYDPETETTGPAQLRLRCACHLRDPETNQLVRYTNTYTFPGPRLNTPPAVIRHDDIEYLVRTDYTVNESANGATIITEKEVLTNIGEAAERAAYYLDAARRRYQLVAAGERHYNGVVPVFCDGKIQQVTWAVDVERGAETIASANSEHAIFVPQYPERVRVEYLKAASERALPGEALVVDNMQPGGNQ